MAANNPQVYDAETFQFFLELDKKRAVRSGRSFLLLLVEGKEAESLSEGCDQLFEALRYSLRETDYLGWYRANRVAGAVLTYTGDRACGDVCLAVRETGHRDSRRAFFGDRAVVQHRRASADVQTAGCDQSMAMTLRSFQTSPIPAKEGLERRDTPAAPISQVLFEGALLRERQRADRCNDPLLLLEVASDDAILISESHWDAVASSIAAATRETDVRGWIRPRAALGVILTENRVANTALVGQLERRIRCELGQDVDTATAGTLSVRLHVYPDSGVPESPGSAAAEGTNEIVRLLPLLEDIRLRSFQQPIYEVVKRAVDIVGSISLLAVLSPLLLLIAAAIRFRSPGPALFQQVRIGREGRSFTMLKFRTMRLDADHGIHQAYVADFIDNVTRISAGKAIKVFKILDDPRVTRLGRLLRRTSLDELPQLWNVVRGDMSLVGPRPPLPYEVAQYKSWHLRRVLESKPGITGLWQVTGRSRTTFDEMVRLDLRYARTRSLWTDLKILLATPRAVIDGKGAH